MQSLPKGTQKIKWIMRRDIRVLVARGSDIPNFLNVIPRIPNFVPRWETTSNPFLKVSKGIYGP